MESIYRRLSELVEQGDTVAVATIIDRRGSVPREVGAKMIVHPLGRHVGTVGGGCGEADVIRTGIEVIASGQAQTVRVDLTEDISMQSLGVCGGILDVFVEQVAPAHLTTLQLSVEQLAAMQTSVVNREPVALVTVVEGPGLGRHALVWLDRPALGELQLGELAGQVTRDAQDVLRSRQHRLLSYDLPAATPQSASVTRVFVEVQRRAPELIIVGAGHIAVPLAQVAGLCDFAVTVLDDRPMYANTKRFPTAQRVIAAPLRETLRELPLDNDSFVVLVTRGHAQDVDCLLEVLERPVAYIGMIGSQRRVDAVFKLMADEQGIDPVKFDRVYAPIGLDIGAHTPAEIAVCIQAEMINVYRGGPAASLSERRRARDRARRTRSAQPADK